MRDRDQIRRMFDVAGTVRGTARELGAGRNTVRRALDRERPDRYQRPSLRDEYEPAVRDVLADHPRLSVQQVAEIIEWPGSRRQLARIVAELRPSALERETEDLNRATAGALRVGRINSVGRVTARRVTVRRSRGGQEDADPVRAA